MGNRWGGQVRGAVRIGSHTALVQDTSIDSLPVFKLCHVVCSLLLSVQSADRKVGKGTEAQ